MNQKANVEVTLNNEQAKRELEELQSSMKKLVQLRDEAFKKGDVSAFKAYDAELKKASRTAANYQKELFDIDKVMRNISGASVNDLRKAQSKLTAEVSKLDRTTAAYAQRSHDLKRVKAEMAAINNETRATQSRMSRMADGFNKYAMMATAWVAGIAGFSMTVKTAVQSYNDFEERVSNLSALTGLVGDDLNWLGQQAKDLSVATLEGGIVVTNSAKEIVDAFTKVGSARPELLKDKEALVEVTKEAMILSAASKEQLQPSIEALTMVMNQYNTSAGEARRIINAVAAGSKEGAGEIPYITTAFEKAGTVASDAGISIETLVATIETLAPRITAPEIAGRSLKGVLLDMQTGADDTNPAIVGLSTALENLAAKNLSVTELTKMFGTENITTARILLKNVAELKKYEAAVTGTNVAIEQAIVNTDNNNAKILQAKNRIALITMELGEKLAPAYAGIISKSSAVLKATSSLVDIISKYWKVILGASVAIAAYTIALRLNTAEKRAGFLLTKTGMVLEKGYAAVKGLLTGQIKLATIAQRAWNTSVKANPIGATLAVIAAVATAIWQLTKNTREASAAQKALNAVEIEANQSIVEQKLRVQDLIKIAQSEKQTLDNRKAALDELNRISPEFFGNLTLETINTEAAKTASDQYTEALLKNARAIAARDKLVEIEKEFIDAELSGANKKLNFWQQTYTFMRGTDVWVSRAQLRSRFEMKNAAKAQDDYNKSLEAMRNILDKNAPDSVTPQPVDKTPAEGDEKVIDGIRYAWDGTKWVKVKTAAPGSDNKEEKAARKAIDDSYNLELLKLKTYYASRENLQKEYNARAIALEIAYLNAQEALAPDESAKVKIKQQIIDAQQRYNEALRDAVPEMIENEKANEKLNDRLLEQSKLMGLVATRQQQAEADMKVLTDQLINQAERYKETIGIVSDGLYEMMSGTENAFQAFARNIIIFALEQLKLQAEIAAAGVTIQSLASPESIATLGAAGIAKAALIIGLIEAAFAVVEGLVNSAFTKKTKKPAEYFEGGDTGPGSKYEPAGIVHRSEYVIPSEGTQNRQLRPVIDAIEIARRNNRLAQLNLTDIIETISLRGYAQGGPVVPVAYKTLADEASNLSSKQVVSAGMLGSFRASSKTDEKQNEILAKLAVAVDELLKWKPTVYTEDIRKGLSNLDHIDRNRGM
jgi:TP901 family phage tail tape measure protein